MAHLLLRQGAAPRATGVPPKVSQCHRDSEKSQHPQHTYAWDLGLPSIC